MMNTYLVIILAIFGTVQQIKAKPKIRKLASYIVPCHKNDPNLNECWIEHGNNALKTIVEGDAAHKIRELHPLKINDIVLQPSPTLKLHFTDVVISGIEKSKLSDGVWDIEKNKISIKITIPRIEIIGNYETDGKILILPIKGNGDGNITLINAAFDYNLEYTIEEINAVNLLKFKNHDMIYKAERVYYLLNNLFNGNKQLGIEMNKFLNENWEEIDKELSPSMIEVLKTLTQEVIINLLKNVPFDEIFLP